MESKQLNKIIILLALTFYMNVFSQMKMADIENKKFSVNLTTEKNDIIKILDNNSYSVFYILDRRGLDFGEGVGTVDMANLIFFSKKYNKGIVTIFKQSIEHDKKSVYNIKLFTGSHDKYMFLPSMIIVDKDFNYEYLMEYYYMPPPPPEKGDYTSWITLQDTKNYCNTIHIDLKGNVIYENIDYILSSISKMSNNKTGENCNSISNESLKYVFPKKINKDGHVYYKK
jgi:hypothetical protein